MMVKRSLIIGTLFVTALAMSAGCSSKSDTSKGSSDKGTGAKGCPSTEITVKITETGDTAKLTYAAGVSMGEGSAYSTYVTDSEIDASKISFTKTPEPVKDHFLVSIFLTTYNPEGTPPPIAEGTKIPFTTDFGVLTFGVIAANGDESYNASTGGKGDVTVTKVGNTVCYSIDYTDDVKTVTGTVEAKIKSL